MADDTPVQKSDAERAAAYDTRIRRLAPGYDTMQQTVAAALAARLPDTARLLVAGAGTGAEIAEMGTAHPQWHFTAADPSPDMLDRCRARVAEAGLESRVEHVCRRVEDISPSPRYDAATSLLVAHFIRGDEAKRQYFRALAASLRPGAPLVWADLYRPASDEAFRRLRAIWRRQMHTRMTAEAVDRVFGRIEDGISFVRPASQERIVTDAGFTPPTQLYQHLVWGAWVATTQE